jgi:hypothetical protein
MSPLRYAFAFAMLAFVAAPTSAQDQVAGVWRGESICASDRAACVDERVVYYISVIAEKPGVVSIRADKIVNGQDVTMGTGEWKHDAEHHALVWDTPRQIWLLKIEGNTIKGTLTLADKTIIRRMTLVRDR